MRHYFITGATGVVGSAFLKRIVNRRETATLLIRADTEALAQERLKKVILKCGIPALACRQVRLIRGDLCQPEMGLDVDGYQHLASTCTHIVHCAGNVQMNLPMQVARRQTLTMTHNVLELMSTSKAAKKMEFVSTVGVVGRQSGRLAESWVTGSRQFRNSYEAAKAEAEENVHAMVMSGMPITVHRPSMVVGDSRTGETVSFQVFYHLCEFLSGARSFGILPKFNGMKLDIIPCDYVAALLEASSVDGAHRTAILHSCSGRSGAIELTALQDRVRRLFNRRGRKLPATHFLPVPLFKLVIRAIKPLLSSKQRRALGALPYFLSYLEEKQYFANTVTKRFIQSKKIDVPNVDHYLETILQYYLSMSRKEKSS